MVVCEIKPISTDYEKLITTNLPVHNSYIYLKQNTACHNKKRVFMFLITTKHPKTKFMFMYGK